MLKIQSHFSRTKFQPAYSVHQYQLVKKMPVLTRDHLALQLQRNWMAMHPMDTCSNGGLNLDDSLTSLNWLQNLNILKITTPTRPSSPSPLTLGDFKPFKVNPNSNLNVSCGPPTTKMSETRFLSLETSPPSPTTAGGDSIDYSVDYKANTYMKPPYSYATLICMAMKETKTAKITLSAIYSWITENFMYYRLADPSWQNSIRHNLSLNKCFQKVPRRKDEPGKGGFWRINPDYSDHIENGVFKKRRNSKDGQTGAMFITPATLPLNLKRTKCETDDDGYEAYSSGQQPVKLHRLDDGVFQICENDENDGHLKVDFSWTSILNQDIDIGGIKVQPEDLIGSSSEQSASPIGATSPLSSDSNSVSDFGFEDLLGDTELSPSESPLDFTTNDSLNLQIVGQSIKAPGWWADSFNGGETRGLLQNIENLVSRNGPNSPVTQSLVHDDDDADENLHPWFDRTVLNADTHFDVDTLFTNSSPHI